MIAQQSSPQEALKYIRLPLEMLDNKWATSSDVVIYAFMLNRYLFFKSIGKPYYENISGIAKGSRQAIATVKRAIIRLKTNGYIEVNKLKLSIGCSNSYIVKDIHGITEVTRTVIVNKSDSLKPKRYSDQFLDDEDDLF